MAYRGVVGKLPIGSQGFTGTRNPSQAGPGHLTYVDGAELYGGIIRKEGGARKLNVEALGGIPDTLTKLLLHMDGTDTSTTFTDNSPAPHTFTANGTAQIDTAAFKFGTASGLFAGGTSGWIDTPDSTDFTLGSGDWTCDFWFFIDASDGAGGAQRLAAGQCDSAAAATTVSLWFERTSANKMRFLVGQGSSNLSTASVNSYTGTTNPGWHHFAAVRSGNTLFLFIDGLQENSQSISGAINDSSNKWAIGRLGELNSAMWLGWIDEFRFSLVARWTTNFTPPTFAYTNLVPPGATVISGINWDPTPGLHTDVVFLSNGEVRADTGPGNFSSILASALTSVREPPPCFVPAGGENVGSSRKLFLFSSPNQAQVASGVGVFGAIPSPPADWTAGAFPTFGILHGLRMFAGGNSSDPHRIYYSTIANHGDFTGAGSGTIAIYPGEGERLVAGVSFRGALILLKYPFGIYVVNTSDLTPGNWQVARMTRAVGTLNQACIIQIENDVLYMDHVGNVHALSATQEFGDINTDDLSKFSFLEPFISAEINRSVIRRTQGIWYAAKRQAWYVMSRLGVSDNNLRLIMGFDPLGDPNQQRVPPRFVMSRRDVAVSMWMRPDSTNIPRPTVGDNNGFVWILDTDAKDKAGVAYTIDFETANTDLSFLDPSLATKMKAGQFLEVASEPRGNWDLSVEVFWDDNLTDTLQFNMGGSGAALGSFTLDTDKLGSDVVSSQRRRLTGSGRRIKLACSNSGLDQDVSIAEFHLSFNIMDERTR